MSDFGLMAFSLCTSHNHSLASYLKLTISVLCPGEQCSSDLLQDGACEEWTWPEKEVGKEGLVLLPSLGSLSPWSLFTFIINCSLS